MLSSVPAGDGDVGEELSDLHADLAEVRASIANSNRRLQELRGAATDRSRAYVAIVTEIDSGLRVDPDPADPDLQRRWRQALSALDRLASDDQALVGLLKRVTGDGETAAEIAEELRSGIDMAEATPAERQIRDRLAGEADSTVGLTATMLTEAQQDLATRRAYTAAERANLQILRLAIANGERYGISLANRAAADAARADEAAVPDRGDGPLVVIRFEDANVRYGQPLYRAATLALERRADALFTLVAVAPQGAMEQARQNAGKVRQTLAEMGLPATQLTETDRVDPAATGAEGHVYVR